MIIEHYPTKKKKNFLPPINLYSYPKQDAADTKTIVDAIVKKPNTFYEAQAKRQGCTVEEWLRRDAIVKAHFKECPYNTSDKVWPTTNDKIDQYGEVQIDTICYTYAQMDKDKWPSNDNPLIVTARSLKNNYSFFCTTNFLTKEEPKKEQNGTA